MSRENLITWQTDHCTPWRMAFEVLLNAKAAFSFAQAFSALTFLINLPEQAPTKAWQCVL